MILQKKPSKVHSWQGTKDEWNQLNSNFKKKKNYHKRTKHHTSLKEMIDKEHDKNLLWQFNKIYNETIEMF